MTKGFGPSGTNFGEKTKGEEIIQESQCGQSGMFGQQIWFLKKKCEQFHFKHLMFVKRPTVMNRNRMLHVGFVSLSDVN